MTTRRSYKGNAAQTTLSGGISSGATAIPVVDGSSFPDGSAGPFFVVLDKGLVGEEKILVATRVGNSFTVATRGQDDSTAAAHSTGATVNHCFTKTDADEANAHTSATTGVHGVTGAVVGTTDTQTLTNKTLTAPTITSPVITGLAARGCRVNAAGTQTLGNGVGTAVLFANEDWDTDAFHDTATNTSRLTVPAGLAGKYLVWANVNVSGFPSTLNGTCHGQLLKNGANDGGGVDLYIPTAASKSGVGISLSGVINLSVGDYVEIQFSNNLGVTVTVAGSGALADFGLQLLGT